MWQEMSSLGFDLEEYDDQTIYSYHLFLEPDSLHTEDMEQFRSLAKPLDVHFYWEKRGEDSYQILLTKTAYVIQKPAIFFTSELLSSDAYIASTMPEAELSHEDSIYHIAVGFGSPDIDYAIHFFNNDEFSDKYPKLQAYFGLYDHIELLPAQISLQHNFLYSRVLFQQTSKMSISITRYFEKGDEETLVMNYTLNYIFNMPPDIIGGKEYLLKKINEGIRALVRETKEVCETKTR